jgi:hypothetical protein
MQSIADGEWEKARNLPPHVVIDSYEGQGTGFADPPDSTLSAEDRLIREEEMVEVAAILRKIWSLFDDDRQAQAILEGEARRLSAEQIRNLTGLQKTEYQSKRRLIRRRINSAFPDGWKL